MTSDRIGMMAPVGMGMGMPSTQMGPGMMPGMTGLMVPRCTMKMEKISGGMKCVCTFSDKTAAAMMQQLCMMNPNGMMGCCMMMNGMCVCQCCISMGMCKVEMSEMGCIMTCTSGDASSAKMIGACCDCMNSMMMPGCTCYMTMNYMPVCCCVC